MAKKDLPNIPQDKIGEVFIWRDWLSRIPEEVNMAYGYFYSTATQTVVGANAVTLATFNASGASHLTKIGAVASRIYVVNSGNYQISVSVEFSKPNASLDTVWFWGRLNGTDIPGTSSSTTVSGNGTSQAVSFHIALDMSTNDYFELAWASTDAAMTAAASVAQTNPFPMPSSPSFHLTINQTT